VEKVDALLHQLDQVSQRGRQLRSRAETPSSGAPVHEAIRVWQRDCAALINELSGGSKAHWLSRAFSGAMLVRSRSGAVVVEANVMDIVDRILDVLAQARASLGRLDAVAAASSAPPARRFEFVHNPQLRPVLEQAYRDGARAFDGGDFQLALITTCGILEAIITDALEHASGAEGRIAGWSFDTRIAAAEEAGLIRGGCARLPPVARAYRQLAEADSGLRSEQTISERDAKLARQVLHVVMRDLDPGR
jgi:hypothetical protein